MKRFLLGWCCLILSGAALAFGSHDAHPQVKASMMVTGWVEVAPMGKVVHYALDRPSRLPPGVVKLIGQSVPGWQFELAETGDAPETTIKAQMQLRVVAIPFVNDHYQITLAAAYFDTLKTHDRPSSENITIRQQYSAIYPTLALQAGVSGTVYLVMEVDRQGRVHRAAAEQVDLGVRADADDAKWWRSELANAALSAARRWRFNPPTSGPEVAKSSWLVKVPFVFHLGAMGEDSGVWHAYVPGPRTFPAWAGETDEAGDPNAIPAGSLSEVGHGLRLTTPLAGI